MRFINDFDWKKTMQYGWRRILRALVRPFAAIRLKFRRLSNPNTLVNTVVTDVQAEVKKAVSKSRNRSMSICWLDVIMRRKSSLSGF